MHECQTGDSPHRWTVRMNQSINTMMLTNFVGKNKQTLHASVKLLYHLIFTYNYLRPCIKNQFHMKFHEFSWTFQSPSFFPSPIAAKEPATSRKILEWTFPRQIIECESLGTKVRNVKRFYVPCPQCDLLVVYLSSIVVFLFLFLFSSCTCLQQ